MKNRSEVAKFIAAQFVDPRIEDTLYHYGKQELKQLMDFIYEGIPQRDCEQLDFDTSMTTPFRKAETKKSMELMPMPIGYELDN